jgi:multiple sugar transport system substrate-binding protein
MHTNSKVRLFSIVLAVVMVLSLILSACAQQPAQAPAAPAKTEAAAPQPAATEKAAAATCDKPVELVVFWHQGGLGDYLVDIAKQYTELTNGCVTVRGEFVPYGPQWHDKIAADFAAHSNAVDLTVFDSQSMSEFASGGHVVKINDLLANSKTIKLEDFDKQALATYAEYPEGSGDLYALPVNQDSMGLVYRKDLFEDPKEKEAFKAKYGYELAVPKTYDEMRDIAEFFTRPDQNLYGIATYGSRDYDAVTSPFDGVLWSWGAELWDSKEFKAEGVINSDAAVKACEYYAGLFKYGPPGMSGWFYDEVNNAVHQGLVAMAINWFYFFHTHADPKSNPKFYDKVAFENLPGEKGPDGQFRQFQSVGGQGLGISQYSDNKDEAWKFIEWFMTKPIQEQWTKIGAQTGRVDILTSPEYTQVNSFNQFFPTAMSRVKDYWHLAEYPQLLDIFQKNMSLAVSGELDCKTALDNTAKEQQPILDAAKAGQ